MSQKDQLFEYSPLEEQWNIYTHGMGILASIVGFIFLILREDVTVTQHFSNVIFGLSLLILYTASTVYHSTSDRTKRKKMKIVDHSAIYILIAGSYTPFALVVLPSKIGWIIFGVAWGLAIVGCILKYFFTGQFGILSTLMYVFMGWLIIFAYQSLLSNISDKALFWLVLGGFAYTIGAIFYSIKKIPFNHAIFHLFVLGGSFCHYIAIYLYI